MWWLRIIECTNTSAACKVTILYVSGCDSQCKYRSIKVVEYSTDLMRSRITSVECSQGVLCNCP